MNARKQAVVAILILWATVIPGAVAAAADAVEVFVAAGGNDAHPGTKAKPLQTLEAARDAVRKLRSNGSTLGPVTVWIRGGTYHRSQTFKLEKQDSGTADAPVAYRAFGNEKVYLVGGREIEPSWCAPVSDAAVLEKLDEAVRAKVLAVDLRAHGIGDYGELSIAGPMLELFCDGRRLPLARWPNQGWARIAQVVQLGEDGAARLVDAHGQAKTFQYEGDRPQRWVGTGDACLHGFWWYGWMDQHVKVARIDTQRREITLAENPSGGIRKDQWYCAINLLPEIDEPGEWYLDRPKGVLYLWPPEGFPDRAVTCSLLAEPLLALADTSHVTVQGLTLEATRGVGAVIAGGADNRLAGCIIRGIGAHAVILDGGSRNGVLGCDVHDVGSTGVHVTGGIRATLTPAGNYVVNSHIHHFAQRKKVYQPAVRLYGVGHRVAHNLIHDAPHQAIAYDGNDHVMELSEIHDVVLDSSDAGVFYTGRDWTFRGNVVRHNFIHHIPHRPGFGSKVVYLDDCASSTEVLGNVFYRTSESVFIGGGRDNVAANNVFVQCRQPVHLDTRGLTWEHFRPGGPMYEPLRQFRHTQPPWSARYPALARILDEQPQAPLGNVVARNVSYRSSWHDPDAKYVRLADNFITDTDPGFVDAAAMDFRLRDDSIVYRRVRGFERIPFEKIGLYQDQYRATWPVARSRKERPE